MSTAELVNCLRQHLPAILEGRPVLLAYLYGSAARGEMTPLSDIDIALVATHELPPQERLHLMLDVALEVEDRCELRQADVRVINDAPLVLQGEVVTEGILLYSSDEAERVYFETTIRSLYFDYLPVYRRLQDDFLTEVRRRGLYYGRLATR